MEHVKKMILVDPKVLENKSQEKAEIRADRVLSKLESTLNKNTTIRDAVISKLDNNMREVLNDKSLAADEKIKHYHQILQRYLLFQNHPNSLPINTTHTRGIEVNTEQDKLKTENVKDKKTDYVNLMKEEVLKSIPKKYEKEANILLKHIETRPEITYNEKGEFAYRGNTVKGSNIFDLMNDILRKRKQFVPSGWTTFSKALKETNVPLSVIGNSDRLRHIKEEENFDSPKLTKKMKRQGSPLHWEDLNV